MHDTLGPKFRAHVSVAHVLDATWHHFHLVDLAEQGPGGLQSQLREQLLPLAASIFRASPNDLSSDDALVFAGWVTDNQSDDEAALNETLSTFYAAMSAAPAAKTKFSELLASIGGAKLFL